MYGYIYKTTNLDTGLIYIGQKKSDKFLANRYLGSGKKLKSSIKSHGRDRFEVELLEECESYDELNDREIYWISKYNSTDPSIGYNISLGGDVPRGIQAWNKGITKEDDIRLVQKESTLKKRSESLKKAYREGRHNIDFTDEVRKKMSDRAKNRPHPPTTAGRVWVNDGNIEKSVKKDMVESYISRGFCMGRLYRPRNRKI